MALERKLIADNIKKLVVKEYLEKELDRAGLGEIEIQRTPIGTRVIIAAQRPGLVIGRKGQSIRKYTSVLKSTYGLDNPQIEVNELNIPELNAQVMAKQIASSLERGIHFRRAAYTALRRIMEAGARGVEIDISGKLTGERSKSVKFIDGFLKHCGEPAILYVDVGIATANPKPGVLGVKVKIMPPGIKLPDDISFKTEIAVEKSKKKGKIKEEIEELVEDIQEELGDAEEGEALKIKKIKVEKVKKKAQKESKKKTDADEVLEEMDLEDAEPEDEGAPGEEKVKEVKKPKAKKTAGKEEVPEEEKVKEVKKPKAKKTAEKVEAPEEEQPKEVKKPKAKKTAEKEETIKKEKAKEEKKTKAKKEAVKEEKPKKEKTDKEE